MDFFRDINSLNAVDVIGKLTALKKAGSNYNCCCPFHNEKTPSLVVSPKSNTWHCYGCGEGTSNIDFVMKLKNMSVWDAACYIANEHGIAIPKQTPEAKEEYDRLEKLRAAISKVHRWFMDQLPKDDVAMRYLAARWNEKTISDWQLGYAPEGFTIVDFAKENNITQELLAIGVLKKSEKGTVYSFFQDRIIFPVHDANGRLVAFTGRVLRDSETTKGKYINSPESELYTKGNILFGLNRAMRNISEKKRMYLVEGNPDVITLHSIKKVGTVAPMGTALTDEQIAIIKKIGCMVVMIGDADAAGQNAVDKNARNLIKAGVGVSVVRIMNEEGKKEDPDSFFNRKSKDFFDEYIRKNISDYILQHTRLQAEVAENNADMKSRLINEVSQMVAYYSDANKRKVYIEELSKIIKPKSVWTSALKKYISDKSDEGDFIKSRIPAGVSAAEVARDGFYQYDNSYFFKDKDDFHKGSNFVLRPLFHVQSMVDNKRLYEVTNYAGYTYTVEIPGKDMISLPGFKAQIERLGDFIWYGSETDLGRLKTYLYANTQTCLELKQLGWHKAGFWAWSNGIFNGKFTKVDEFGIVTHSGVNYYIPAFSKTFANEDTLYVSERRFKNNEGKISFPDLASKMVDVFGENAKIGICFYIASLFRDFIFRQFSFFPILNLFGPKGAGKTECAVALMQFFGNMPKGPNMSNSTLPALSDHIAMTANACTHIDEYKNSVDFTKVEFLKGLWDGTGRSRMNMDKDKKKEVTSVDSGVILSGQEMPTADIALFSRLIFLSFTQTEYSQEEKDAFQDFKNVCAEGLTHITNSILVHREYFVKHYLEVHDDVMRQMVEACDITIEDRIMRNWCVVMAALATIEDKLQLPFSFEKMKAMAARMIIRQNSEVKKGNEVSIFWSIFEYLVTAGDIQEDVDFRFDFCTNIKTDRVDKQLSRGVTLIYLRKARVFQLYRKHGNSTKENILPIKTLEYYLVNCSAYLGEKTVKFRRNADEDDTIIDPMGGTNKHKRIPTTAMVFDYDKLGISVALETDTESSGSTFIRPADEEEKPAPTPKPQQLQMEDLGVRKVDI